MKNVKYAVIEMPCVTGKHGPFLMRYEGKGAEKIVEGRKLPACFQRELYGSEEWKAVKVIWDEDALVLEGIRLIAGQEKADNLIRRIFQAGQEAPKDKP